MKTRVWRCIIVYGCIGVLLCLAYLALEVGAYFSNIILPWHRGSALAATCEMGGLAPFPDTASRIDISTSGSAFTRTFEATFHAPPEDIRTWVRKSKRLRDNKPRSISPSRHHYEIRPGEGGANGGWVEIDWESAEVAVYMEWS